MKIVFFVKLLFYLTLDTEAHYKGIALASDRRRVRVDYCQGFLEGCDTLSCGLFLLLHVVLKVPRERLDLLDLLRQISSETTELIDDICLDITSLVGLGDGLFVKVAEDAVCIIQSSLNEQRGGCVGVVDDV